ncbi:MAG: hypothetical protein WBP56_20620 [Polyangia bacterium]
MTFRFRNLNQLGNRISVPIPKDPDGSVGRECPAGACLGYFKIKPGTGLTGDNLPCFCPYCGHKAVPRQFFTKEQIEFAKSHAMREIGEAIHRDLKQLEFDHPARGSFGIGVSLKVTGGRPVPIRYYREKALETCVTCGTCTLEYAIYGVFAFCPDCGVHNSEQILEKNLNLVAKQVEFLGKVEDGDLRRHLLEDALENCVSSLDGFGRATCRVRADQSKAPEKCAHVSFQNLPKAARRMAELFGIDLVATVAPEKWAFAHRGFMKRHVVAHCAGVVDQQYIDETHDAAVVVGHKITLDAHEVSALAEATMEIGAALIRSLPKPNRERDGASAG